MYRGRRVRLGQQPAEVTALAGQPRVLDEEERVAVGPLQQCVGFGTGSVSTSTSRSTTSAAWSALSPVSSIRTACARASISATSARAPVGGGCDRQVLSTSRDRGRSLSISSRSTRSDETSAQCRSSKINSSGWSSAGLQDGRHDPFPDSELGDLILVSAPVGSS